MPNINQAFTKEEKEALTAAKNAGGFKNWHDFIMSLVPTKLQE